MRFRLLALTPWLSLAVATVVACGASTTQVMNVPTSGNANGDSSGSSSGTDQGQSSGTSSGTGSGSGVTGSGATAGGSSGAASGSTPSSGTGSSGSAPSSGVNSDAGGSAGSQTDSGAGAGSHPVIPSPGCTSNSVWNGPTGQWVSEPDGCAQGNGNQGTSQCQTIPPGANVPSTSGMGTPEHRGWWVYVPTGYNPTKPYRVIYSGAGCDDADWFHAGDDGFPYNNVDDAQAILVGLDYDTYSDVPGCYDNRDPQSNDFTFFPWLQNQIETQFCVDKNHEFFSGYSSGSWVMQQFNCAFPDKLRGSVGVTGCEPGAPGYPGAQYAPCVDKPTAAFYVKDYNDTDNTYACILPACTRMLKQNGCSVTTCNPLDKTTTTPYTLPAGVTLPQGASCVQFNGCPTDYPVVFCVTYNQGHGDGQSWGTPKLFWDWMTNKLN